MVQSEALKRSKAKYYKKVSQSDEFKEQNRENMKKYYEANREKHIEAVRRCQQRKKEEFERLKRLVDGLGLV
jgi:hypothetical protein